MQGALDSDFSDPIRISLGHVFGRMDPEFRMDLVKRTLLWREQASPRAREALRKAVSDSVFVDGFRNAGLAPAAMLFDQVAHQACFRGDLAGATLRIWVESQEQLWQEITNHLGSREIETQDFNFPNNEIPMDFDDKRLLEARRSFLESHPDIAAEKVSLLIELISGRMTFDDESEDDESNFVETMLEDTYEALDLLPPDAPEWQALIPEFVDWVTALMGAKEQALNQATTLDSEFAAIREQFAELVQFFQWNAIRWAAANLWYPGKLPVAYDRAVDLKELLSRYAPVHERAPSAPEELERATLRIELMPRMLEHGRALDEMMESGDDWDDDEFEPARLPDGGSGAGPVDNGPSPENPPDPDSDTEPQQSGDFTDEATVGQESTHLDQPGEPPSCSIEHYLLLRLENRELEQENDDLDLEVQSLKEQLFESRSQGEGLKLAMASQGNDAGRGEGAPAIDDVTAAFEEARERFAGRLLFQLNSESALEGNTFKWPDRFWRALEWLATSYYDSRTGQAAITDLDESCRSASGMWYKSSQHDVTMAAYRNWYTTKVGGRNIWLQEHIGKGTGFDPRRTIRIAFDWDRTLQQVIIGYIGRHQRTSAS